MSWLKAGGVGLLKMNVKNTQKQKNCKRKLSKLAYNEVSGEVITQQILHQFYVRFHFVYLYSTKKKKKK